MRLLLTAIVLIHIAVFTTTAQNYCPIESTVLETGRLRAHVTGVGLISGSSEILGSAVWRDRRGVEQMVSSGLGLWVGGRDPAGNLKLATQQYGASHGQRDYFAGPIDGRGERVDTSSIFCAPFLISGEEVKAHLRDFSDGRIDNPLPAVIDWPGRGNAAYGVQLAAADYAPFVDTDGDGLYDPLRGDYPAISGDQAAWWMMNDLGVHEESGVPNPLGVEVRGLLQGFDEDTDEGLGSTLRVTYEITNRSVEEIDGLIASLWQDQDVGCDYFSAIGTIPGISAVYRYPVAQTSVQGCDGDAGGNSSHPIVLSTILGTYVEGVAVDKRAGAIATLRPSATDPPPAGVLHPTHGRPQEFYRLMGGRWRDGSLLREGNDGYGTDGPATDWIYSGNPADSTEWSSCRESRLDIQTLLSTRPNTTLAHGQTLTVDFALAVLEDIPSPCPDSRLIAEATERITAELLAQPIVSAASNTASSRSRLSVFPNPSGPAGFTIRITDASAVQALTITDAVGRTHRSYATLPAEGRIRGLPGGLYVISIQYTDGDRVSRRIAVAE